MLLSLGKRLVVSGALLLTLVGGPAAQAQSAATLATADNPDLGTYLTDQSGMTLYMYTKDDVGLSNCYGG